jgi:hypothetical protein
MTFIYPNGRVLDDVDMLKLRVLAREWIGYTCDFFIQSEDGTPMTGVSSNSADKWQFIAIGVRRK